jgi:hypothetical protein
MAMATWDAVTGHWVTSVLTDLPRFSPWPSSDPGDPAPRISYIDPQNNHYWREIDNPASETMVPQVPKNQNFPMRFVRGARATVFVAPVGASYEVFRYWLDTQSVEQLTFDRGRKNIQGLFMWQAPEFDNDYVFSILANNNTELRVYRQLDKALPQWT